MDGRGIARIGGVPCPAIAPPFPDCELVDGPAAAPYPDCCPELRCPGRCFSERLSRWFSKGEEWTEEGCTRAFCTDTDQIGMLPCGLVALPSDRCSLVSPPEAESAEYPRCCPALRCPGACYSRGLQRLFDVGASWTEPGCTSVTCIGTEMVVRELCEIDYVPGGCTVVDGTGDTFPDCCPVVQCPY